MTSLLSSQLVNRQLALISLFSTDRICRPDVNVSENKGE